MMSVWDLLRIFAKRKPRFKYAYSVDVRYLSGICSVFNGQVLDKLRTSTGHKQEENRNKAWGICRLPVYDAFTE